MDGKYIDLSRVLMWKQLPSNWDPQSAFGQTQPLHLEVGFGNGEHLCLQAQHHPTRNYLGIEIHWQSVRRSLRRLAQQRLDNVRLLLVDAHTALRYLVPDKCLQGFVALFPCPWPKREHERFRLFSQGFMRHLHRSSQENFQGLVVTDHPGLRDFALQQAEGSGFQVNVQEQPARHNTKYERRWLGEGQELFYELHYRRDPASDNTTLPQLERTILQTLHLHDFDPSRLQLNKVTEPWVIQYREQLFDPQRRVWMVLTTVIEDSLNQTFWIEASQAEVGQAWALRPAAGGGFLPTLAVEAALKGIQQAWQEVKTG